MGHFMAGDCQHEGNGHDADADDAFGYVEHGVCELPHARVPGKWTKWYENGLKTVMVQGFII